MGKKVTCLGMWLASAILWIRVVTVHSADDAMAVKMSKRDPVDTIATYDNHSRQKTTESGKCTSINDAPAKQLVALPGIGPVIAQRIIEYRTNNGPFASIREIDRVKGIGPATLRKLEGLLCL
jgi:competence ComEA-like helix-hairpin-helix protein